MTTAGMKAHLKSKHTNLYEDFIKKETAKKETVQSDNREMADSVPLFNLRNQSQR